jgi:hypothetical protein
MAWIIGYASDEEITELRARGWEVESAAKFKIVGILRGNKAIAIWVDTSVMDIFNGPDWDKSKVAKL